VEPRKEPNFSYRLLRAIYPVFRVLFPNQVIRADDLARPWWIVLRILVQLPPEECAELLKISITEYEDALSEH
jgi:hypothetical protein